MERIYEELDEIKAENEKLRADCKSKSELCGNLKKAHNEQLLKIQEANLKVEKQARELNEKTEEISEVKQLFEGLKRSLTEKESIIKCLGATNDKLRFDFNEKCRKLEEQNRVLVLALDEANEKNIDQEQKVNVFKAEIEGLKGLLSASQKKCVEAEREAKAPKKLRERDDMLLKSEDENRKFENQLKWKKEQFKHLEEAHEKLKDQFRTCKKEWEHERSTLLDAISSLQTSLDSQTRISGDLQNRLQLCNQALSHEESRRKYLEVQVSEFRTRYDNTFAEYQDKKSQLECLTNQRDKEIAALRHSLGTKETFYKEMEYQVTKLERENQELLMPLKELQEAQIQKGGSSSSLAKLRNKLRSVEQMHRDCSANLRAKEAEWSSQMQQMDAELNGYRSELERKDAALKELKMELEDYHSLTLQLKMQNEEISVMLLVLKAGVSEVQFKLEQLGGENDISSRESKDHVNLLMKQLEMKSAALAKAQTDIEEEREKTASFLRRIESFDRIEEHSLLMQKELDRYKEALEESSKCQLGLKEQVLLIECDYKKKLGEVCDALDAANLELAEEREKTASLSTAVESVHHIEEQRVLMQKELENYQEMLEKSLRCQRHLEEQAKQIESDSERKLGEVSNALDIANLELAKEREKTASLSEVVESLDHIEEQRVLMEKELQKNKEKLEEASRYQLCIEEKAKQMESDSKRKLQEATDALDIANSELAEKTSEGHQIEFELWIWKSIAERLKFELEENQELRKELEASLLAQVEVGEVIKQENCGLTHSLEERDSRTSKFQQQILSLEQDLKLKALEAASNARMETAMSFEIEKQWFSQITKEKDEILEDLQRQIGWLEEESLRRELESSLLTQICAERSFEHEKESLIQLLEEKSQKIDDLLQLVRSLEERFNSSLNSFSSQLAGKQAEISLAIEAWEKISAAETLAMLEIEEKKLMIVELEDEISNVQQKLELQEKSLSHSKHQAQKIEAELALKQREMKNLTNQLEENLTTSDALVIELRSENRKLLEDVLKLSSERENLLGFLGGLGDRVSKFSDEDMQLMEMLGRLVQSLDSKSGLVLKGDDLFESVKENVNAHPSPATMKKVNASVEERSPFKPLN
ncbi:hypothetical protein WN944_021508 [Citrus x changshan-huyou]|uniref:Uncharacterized protein n=1 Tax=Citrus x changshan-huyou TaxID=2935761 RepID=A0AAP0MWY5_9ROSI